MRAKALILAFTGLCGLTGCTVAPKVVQARTVAYSGNKQDAGILSLGSSDDPATVDATFVANYARLAGKWGKDMKPPVKAGDGLTDLGNGTYLIDKAHLSAELTMNILDRSGIAP
jgi:hypothetical protein